MKDYWLEIKKLKREIELEIRENLFIEFLNRYKKKYTLEDLKWIILTKYKKKMN